MAGAESDATRSPAAAADCESIVGMSDSISSLHQMAAPFAMLTQLHKDKYVTRGKLLHVNIQQGTVTECHCLAVTWRNCAC